MGRPRKRWTFGIEYSTRTVTINGEAVVVGNYDGPSKPLAMVRSALAATTEDDHGVWVTLLTSEGPGMPPLEGRAGGAALTAAERSLVELQKVVRRAR